MQSLARGGEGGGEGGGSGQCIVYTAAWDPHRPSSTILAIDSDIVGWDVRDGSEKTAFSIPNAHGLSARDVDFNPNKPYCFLKYDSLYLQFLFFLTGDTFRRARRDSISLLLISVL